MNKFWKPIMTRYNDVHFTNIKILNMKDSFETIVDSLMVGEESP